MKWRLILGMAIGWTLVFAIGAGSVYIGFTKRLYEKFDVDLLQRAYSIQSMIRKPAEKDTPGELDIEWRELGTDAPPGYREGKDYSKLENAESGEIYHECGELDGEMPPRGIAYAGKVYPVMLKGGDAARCVALWFTPETERDHGGSPDLNTEKPVDWQLILYVAKEDTVVPQLAHLREQLLIFWLVGVLGGGVLTMLVVMRNLRPLEELKDEIRNLDHTDLRQRVICARATSELEPVVSEVNHLLGRVDDAFKRERMMTSNVAHELRTPVAGLLANLEVCLSGDRTREEYRESGEECLEIAKRMHWLVNNLLTLSRLEVGVAKPKVVSITLENTLRMWWREFAQLAEDKGIHVKWSVPSDLKIVTDPEYLRVVMRNLFDNAMTYGLGEIQISADEEGVIRVTNSTDTLRPEMADDVFDPFWRSSESREISGDHVGLGLSICRKVMDVLGGTIRVNVDAVRNVFEAVVILP